jgi:hypothetical protein
LKHTYHRQGHRPVNHLPANTATAGDVYVADYGADGGCRRDECGYAQRLYQRRYRELKANGLTRPLSPVVVAELPQAEAGPVPDETPGPVESAVEDEIGGLAGQARPGLAQAALAMARVLDSPKAVSSQPAAAKVLAALLDKLRSASAPGRRGGLARVRTMTEKGGA